MSAQLPPAVEATVKAAVSSGVDLVLAVVPVEVRRYVEGSPVWATLRSSLTIRLEHWASRLVADLLSPPVRVTAADGAEVKVTVE